MVSFSIGLDTAGEVRVPAAFNGLVGFKRMFSRFPSYLTWHEPPSVFQTALVPMGLTGALATKGTLSARGVSPTCLHQDSVSILASNVHDVAWVWNICKGHDKGDLYAKPPSVQVTRPRAQKLEFYFGVPSDEALEACSASYKARFEIAIDRIVRMGGTGVGMDWYTPFLQTFPMSHPA